MNAALLPASLLLALVSACGASEPPAASGEVAGGMPPATALRASDRVVPTPDGAPLDDARSAPIAALAGDAASAQEDVASAANDDHVIVERARFLDEQGFDRPVEAFSVLLPRGWQSEGGVRWRGIAECRGEIVSMHLAVRSPDGAVRLDALPVRSFGWFDDPFLRNSMQQAAAQGGCEVRQPFDARAYLATFARDELGGARVERVEDDTALLALLGQMDAQSNDISRQYGTGLVSRSSAVRAELAFPGGDRGIALVAVNTAEKQGTDPFTGRPNGFSTTTVLQRSSLRFPPERRDEAERVLALVRSSHRTNPAWERAKTDFLTQLGNIEHQGRMERIRLAGEASRAYAKSASDAQDASLRSWERRQASGDRQHEQFVRAIREVELWNGADESVELTAGYDRAFTRGDGTYLLTNSPTFDPAAAFLDQAWKPLTRAD